ncbi:PilZ domain-containing protein [Marinicella sp. S1101]|uniref:PilZ domain-containing protein n=1 Tax=Marinicella marina TaxID=2996016 RepID=UPI002260FC4C|nr:PilZ domain-containing protein [Marinicella marina]MCX7554455.1 PilZ domain-containing protein [Marinicella marina]MDJ1140606.1 PilZ domain-containing protein [Marinicella marina]
MKKNHTEERRRYTRIPWRKEVTLYSGMEAHNAQILDISLKGVLLENPDNHKANPGDLYRLSIPLENSPAIIMNIQVVHANEAVFGAEWTQIDMDSFASLKRTIELNIEEKELLRDDIKKLSE